MTNESRETQELKKIPSWATECVVMSLTEQETWQEEGGNGQPCFVAARELWASSLHTV